MRLSLPLLLLLPPLAAPSQFKYITYTTLTTKLQDFATLYPTLATLQTTQEEYGLPTVLTCGSSLAPCLNYYLTITDAATSTSPTTSDPYQSPAYKPDVFFSGEVHGDETVGPLATLHTAELLVTAAGCAESHFENAAAPGESERSDSCRLWFQEWGFGTQELYWLAGLVGTRRIIISPMSNPSGFDKTVRAENNIDPNRDFAYDVTSPTRCMRTVTARHINEIFIHSLVQLAVTFHGGMTAIAYEWGAPSHNNHNTYSPDDRAQKEIGAALSDVGGTFTSEIKYPSAPMNEIVYPVHGGMEDWAYAGSWDTERFVPGGCNPSEYGGYDRTRTVYADATLRAFNILVEASTIKKPAISRLGDRSDIFNPKSEHNGHVPRNVRLALLMADIVEPYVQFKYVMGHEGKNVEVFDRDRLPSIGRSENSCRTRNLAEVGVVDTFKVSWVVGGGFDVDLTDVYVLKDGWEQQTSTCLLAFYSVVEEDGATFLTSKNGDVKIEVIKLKGADKTDQWSGTTRWGDSSSTVPEPTVFEVVVSSEVLSAYSNEANEVVFVARARLDSKWGEAEPNVTIDPVGMPPQSHAVNARTNKDWVKENAGKKIQGRLDWFSTPFTVVVKPDSFVTRDAGMGGVITPIKPGGGEGGKEDEGGGGEDEGDGEGTVPGGHYDGDGKEGGEEEGGVGGGWVVVVVLLLGGAAAAFLLYRRSQKRGVRGSQAVAPDYEMVGTKHPV